MACEPQWGEYNSAVLAAQMADMALKAAKTQALVACLQAP